MRVTIPLLAAALLLAACSQNTENPASGESAEAPAPAPRPELTDEQRAVILASLPAPYSEGDLENGRRVFARCRSCHTLPEGGRDMTGPNLWGVFGRQAGARPDFRYSEAVQTAGFTWDAEHLDQWLANPQTYLPGNRMPFAGIPDADDRRDLIAYLKVETGYETE